MKKEENEVVPDITAEELRLIAVKIPKGNIEFMDDKVRDGRYSNRSEIIRMALRDLLKEAYGEY